MDMSMLVSKLLESVTVNEDAIARVANRIIEMEREIETQEPIRDEHWQMFLDALNECEYDRERHHHSKFRECERILAANRAGVNAIYSVLSDCDLLNVVGQAIADEVGAAQAGEWGWYV
jgi:hypothetical protein